MTHTIEKYGDIGNFSGVTYFISPFVILKFVGTWAPTAKMIGDIPDFNMLIVPKTQTRHNPEYINIFSWIEYFNIKQNLLKSVFSNVWIISDKSTTVYWC